MGFTFRCSRGTSFLKTHFSGSLSGSGTGNCVRNPVWDTKTHIILYYIISYYIILYIIFSLIIFWIQWLGHSAHSILPEHLLWNCCSPKSTSPLIAKECPCDLMTTFLVISIRSCSNHSIVTWFNRRFAATLFRFTSVFHASVMVLDHYSQHWK